MTERRRISLTGPDSHLLVREPGVGSLRVGPPGHPADLHVDPGAPVDWSVLDDLTTPDGGRWPRYLTYTGDDPSILGWVRGRPTEGLRLAPLRDVDWDASAARVQELSLVTEGPRVRIALPSPTVLRHLTLQGDPASFDLVPHPEGPPGSVALVLPAEAGTAPRALPPLPTLTGVTSLAVHSDPLGRPLDCHSLGQFPQVRRLDLRGAITRPEALAGLPLQTLELRFVPDLGGLPGPDTWPALSGLIGWNIDEVAGRRLRSQLRALPPDRLSGHSSVSKLRSRRWFVEEYGLPFTAWPARTAKAATRAFRTAAAEISGATDEAGASRAVTAFVVAVNDLPGIETSEREDTATAVTLLAGLAAVPIGAEQALAWFEAARDF